MGRAKYASAITGRAKHRGDHDRRGAFPFGAGNVDDLHPGIGLTKPSEKLARAIELELPRLIRYERRSLEIDAAHQPIERGGARGMIGHRASSNILRFG